MTQMDILSNVPFSSNFSQFLLSAGTFYTALVAGYSYYLHYILVCCSSGLQYYKLKHVSTQA